MAMKDKFAELLFHPDKLNDMIYRSVGVNVNGMNYMSEEKKRKLRAQRKKKNNHKKQNKK